MKKNCPICGSTEWNYDVTNGEHIFCGDCYFELKQVANKYHLLKEGFLFKNKRDYFTALSYATKI